VFVTAVNFSPNRCVATIGGYTYRHIDQWEGFMKYAVEMGSDAMIYIPSIIKTGSGIQKLIKGDIHTYRELRIASTDFYFFFQNKKSRLKL
jgi:hypothetical protein